jgi:hypothetical protein
VRATVKQWISAWLAVFVAWVLLDLVGHGLIFGSMYAALPNVWRPRAEIKIWLIYLGVLVTAAAFVAIYVVQIQSRGLIAGLAYGLLFGLAMGSSLACGGYAVHPIQAELAFGWFVLAMVEYAIAGVLVGSIIGRPKSARG